MASEVIKAKCVICKTPFEKVKGKNKITCSVKCSNARRKQILTEITAKRKAERQANPNPGSGKCKICGREFVRTSNAQKYCERLSCKMTGLSQAISRQTQRRELAKQLKAEGAYTKEANLSL